jgi:hypothetical protein
LYKPKCYINAVSIELAALHAPDGFFGFVGCGEVDKGEPQGQIDLLIHHQRNLLNFSVIPEDLLQVGGENVASQVLDNHHFAPILGIVSLRSLRFFFFALLFLLWLFLFARGLRPGS